MHLSLVGIVLLTLSTWNRVAAQATTTRVSVDSNGAQADLDSGYPSLSGDGRHVAFDSLASDLVPGDTNGGADTFVRDLESGVTERVSVDSAGVQANGISYYPSLSFDGRFVAFHSGASNLVAGDANGKWDVFVRDRQLARTELISLSSNGAQGDGDSGNSTHAISADGRFVVFGSAATNLVAGDTNGLWDVYVRDRQAGVTIRASLGPAGVEPDAPCTGAAISAEGLHVAFHSGATNLVANDHNFDDDVFVRDLASAQATRVSVDSAGREGNRDSTRGVLSGDGRFVEFVSLATNLVAGDTNGYDDVFVHDRQTGATTRVNVSSSGVQGDSWSSSSSISADGRYAAFHSRAARLVPGDTNGTWDAFVHDRLLGETLCISVSSSGAQGDDESASPSISADGRRIAFVSYASNLVAGDTNSVGDVFLRDGEFGPSVFCTAGTTTNGCVASISGTGTPSASSGAGFTIAVASVEGQKQGILFYGVDNSGFAPLPWGTSSSFLCVKQPTQRTPPQNSGGALNACNGAFALDWNAFIAANPSALGQPFTAGQHVFAQAWFRDPPSPKTTHLSNALEFVVQP
jgi:Tol biopolymer transport system component